VQLNKQKFNASEGSFPDCTKMSNSRKDAGNLPTILYLSFSPAQDTLFWYV